MKAAYINNYIKDSNEINFGDLPKPSLRPNHALIKIKAASANPVDKFIGIGFLASAGINLPFPYIYGYDFAGTIEAVGDDVTDFKAGDDVFSLSWGTSGKIWDDNDVHPVVAGAFAEYIVFPVSKLTKKPAGVAFEAACCVGVVGATAYGSLILLGKAKTGTRVLLFGGSTAVGVIIIQLAKIIGAHITVTASTRAMDFVKQFKPDKIINYNENKWEEDPDVKNVDLIIDCTRDKDVLTRTVAAGVAKTGGIFVSATDRTLGLGETVHPPFAWAGFFLAKQNTKMQEEFAQYMAEGKVTFPIDTTFPFTKQGVVDCLEKTSSGKSLGKNILVMS